MTAGTWTMVTNVSMDYRYKTVISVNLESNNSLKLLFAQM